LYAALRFWRGELRAQRIVSANRALTAVQLLFGVGVLGALAYGVRAMLLHGSVPVANVALLGVLGMTLIFSNVLLTGEESGTRVDDLRAWALPRPLTKATLHGFVISTGLLRSAIFTLTLVGAVAVGALSVPNGWVGRGEIAGAAIVLPVPPVTAGLWFSADRGRVLGPGFVSVPFGLSFLATAIRLPEPGGAWAQVVQAFAAPGLTLLGRTGPEVALAVLSAWLLAAVFLLSRLRAALDRAPGVTGPARSPGAARLGDVRRPWLTLDVVTHRIRPGWEAAQLCVLAGLVSAVGVLLIAAGAGPPRAGSRLIFTVVAAATLAIPAATAGYRQLLDATALRPADRDWLRQVPLRAPRVHFTRHLVCIGGAAVSCGVLSAVLAGYFTLAYPAPARPGLVPVLTVLLAPVCLTGWLAVARTWSGIARMAGYLLLTGYALACGIAAAVTAAAALPGGAIAAFALADLAIGLCGHLAAALVMRRIPL